MIEAIKEVKCDYLKHHYSILCEIINNYPIDYLSRYKINNELDIVIGYLINIYIEYENLIKDKK